MKYVGHLFVDAFTLLTSAETSKSRESPVKKKKTGKRNTVISCPASAIGQYRKYCSGRSRALDEAEVACIFARSLTRDPDTRRRGGCPRLAR